MIHFVEKFNERFGLPDGSKDVLTGNQEVIDYRADFMEEELKEFKDAMAEGDRVKAFDALLDLVYVAQGTALFLGINGGQWINGYAAVHKANMSKVPTPSAACSKRNSSFDVIKPPGWTGPEARLTAILFGGDVQKIVGDSGGENE